MTNPVAPTLVAPKVAAVPALHPLVQRLLACHGYALVERLEDIAGDARDLLLFLPAHGKGHMETPDIAVVLPELVKALDVGAGHLGGAVAAPALEGALRDTLSIALPAVVVVRCGVPLGAVPRMRDWDEYLARLSAILAPPAALN